MAADINTIVEIVQDREQYKNIINALKGRYITLALCYDQYITSPTKLPEELRKEATEFIIDKCNKMIEFFDKAIIEEANK